MRIGLILYFVYCLASGPSLGMKRGTTKLSTKDETNRLLGLRHNHYVTQRALQYIVESIKEDGPLVHSSRMAQYRARNEIAKHETPYGRMVEVHTENGMTFGISPPFAAMYYHARNSASYAALLKDTLRRAPCSPSSPWNWILYQDGVDPSDGLSKTHTRKSAVFYWSINEFGYDVWEEKIVESIKNIVINSLESV